MTGVRRHKRVMIERFAHSSNALGLLQTVTTLVPLALLWWAAVLSLDVSLWLTAAITALISLFTLRNLVLMHECGHGSLFRSTTLNRALGFVFGVVAGMPQYVWSNHHNFHHAHNGDWEVYRGPLTTPSVEEFAALTAAQQRTYERTRCLAAAPLGGFIYLIFNPRFTWMKGSVQWVWHALRAKMSQPQISLRTHAGTFRTRYWKTRKEYWHMCWNNLVLLAVWALMCQAIGTGVFFFIYISSVSVAGGAGILLFTVQHNFEHSYAADLAHWDHDRGAVAGTSFLTLPGWLNWFTANIAYHHVHHLSASIPNYRLAACHREYLHLFGEVRRIGLADVPAALKCLLWDQRAQRIISFAEFRACQATGRSSAP